MNEVAVSWIKLENTFDYFFAQRFLLFLAGYFSSHLMWSIISVFVKCLCQCLFTITAHSCIDPFIRKVHSRSFVRHEQSRCISTWTSSHFTILYLQPRVPVLPAMPLLSCTAIRCLLSCLLWWIVWWWIIWWWMISSSFGLQKNVDILLLSRHTWGLGNRDDVMLPSVTNTLLNVLAY